MCLSLFTEATEWPSKAQPDIKIHSYVLHWKLNVWHWKCDVSELANYFRTTVLETLRPTWLLSCDSWHHGLLLSSSGTWLGLWKTPPALTRRNKMNEHMWFNQLIWFTSERQRGNIISDFVVNTASECAKKGPCPLIPFDKVTFQTNQENVF